MRSSGTVTVTSRGYDFVTVLPVEILMFAASIKPFSLWQWCLPNSKAPVDMWGIIMD